MANARSLSLSLQYAPPSLMLRLPRSLLCSLTSFLFFSRGEGEWVPREAIPCWEIEGPAVMYLRSPWALCATFFLGPHYVYTYLYRATWRATFVYSFPLLNAQSATQSVASNLTWICILIAHNICADIKIIVSWDFLSLFGCSISALSWCSG